MAKILVIDDDAALRRTIERMLHRGGHQVAVAANGKIGVALFRADRPDIVVTDIIMEEQEGIETIRVLRREAPGVRILAISGGAMRSSIYLDLAQQLGADATLMKPFDPDTLLQEIDRLLAPTNAAPGD